MVEPVSAIPAKRPRAREYERISAEASLFVDVADDERPVPTGPAAADTLPPTLNSPFVSALFAPSLVTSATNCADWTPASAPMDLP